MKKTIERITISKMDFQRIEGEIRFHEHLRRYAAIRRFCFGRTLDFPCGVGYGSYLLSFNPEITEIIGVDKDKESIEWASKEFSTPKSKFVCADIENFEVQADTLVSLEAIEHFKDATMLAKLADKTQAQQVIVSFPDKKSTHFNPFHLHDFVIQDVVDLFGNLVCYHNFRLGDVQFLLFLKKPANAPSHIFRNIVDLRSN
jgi:SAM-dependent methyltransferase